MIQMISSFEVKDGKLYTWQMIGSHNFSGAALGKLQKNGTQIHISNYELSVFFKPKCYENIYFITNETLPKEIPIPFKIPGQRYKKDESPFIQDLFN
jgi:tyrosyl-DNA phosphodiesterase 1